MAHSATGAHGDPEQSGIPSPWARALTSHCRHAAVTAEAACWKSEGNQGADAEVRDADNDGEPDLIIKNDCVCDGHHPLGSAPWFRCTAWSGSGADGGRQSV